MMETLTTNWIGVISERITKNGNAAVNRVVGYIGSHYAENITLAKLADVAKLSPSYLSALFTRVMGYGFREQLNRVQVEEAKRLLTATDYLLSEIAVSVDFSDQSSFSKVFKRLTGLTPNQFR